MVRVYMDMVGDLFHYGHVNALKTAASHGDYLLVGVHNDEAVASYKRVPIMNMEERIAVIEACKYVNEIIRDAPVVITEEYLKQHQIDKVCRVDNRTPEEDKLFYGVPTRMNIVTVFPYTKTISTSMIIDRVLSKIGY